MKFFFRNTGVIVLIAIIFGSQLALAGQHKRLKIRVFGDSLVDNGNLLPVTWPTGVVIPPLTRYDRGRFSNGLVAVEWFANRLRIPLIPAVNGINLDDLGIDFGIGGSTTAESSLNPGGLLVNGLLGQVGQYEDALDDAGMESENNSSNLVLSLMWTAHNDYYIPFFNGASPDASTVAEAVGNISEAVTRLHARGIKVMVVANMPDLGLPPICAPLPGMCDALTFFTDAHNVALDSALDALEGSLPELGVIRLDVHAIFEEIIADPGYYGFSDVVNAGPAAGCLFAVPFNPANCTLVNFRNTDFLWWDEQHPTDEVHKILGKKLFKLVLQDLKMH